MSKGKNCSACSDLQEYSPEFVLNGVTDNVANSLKNNSGFNPSSGHTDCKDLNDANDCLIGNMEDEVDAYEVCDWKPFMVDFIRNLWTTLKAMIAAICGLWSHVVCLYEAMKNLITILNDTTQGKSFVRYFRDAGRVSGYWWDLDIGNEHTLNIYMDADADDYGTKSADRDYIVSVSNCTNIKNFTDAGIEITCYSSDDTRAITTIRKLQAQHAGFDPPSGIEMDSFSWTNSCSVLIKKGAHVKINIYVNGAGGSSAKYRCHQFVMTWTPVNIDSAISETDVFTCTGDEPVPTPTPTPTPSTHTITVIPVTDGVVNSGTGGTVSGDGTYAEDAVYTLTATANAGYRFVKWSLSSSGSGGYSNSNNPYMSYAFNDTTWYAIFENTTSEKTVTENLDIFAASGAPDTYSHALQNTPETGTTISAVVRKWNLNTDESSTKTFTAGTSSTETIDVNASVSYDGNQTFSLVVTNSVSYKYLVGDVTYTYI